MIDYSSSGLSSCPISLSLFESWIVLKRVLAPSVTISAASEALMDFCIDQGIDKRSATCAALSVEEMAVYTRNRLNKNDYMDILARLYADKIEIDFRTLGNSFNPLVAVPEDIAENIKVLQGIAGKLEYDYIMGMNCTRITIARKEVSAV